MTNLTKLKSITFLCRFCISTVHQFREFISRLNSWPGRFLPIVKSEIMRSCHIPNNPNIHDNDEFDIVSNSTEVGQ